MTKDFWNMLRSVRNEMEEQDNVANKNLIEDIDRELIARSSGS